MFKEKKRLGRLRQDFAGQKIYNNDNLSGAFRKKLAFTLAEVLVVLTIIGVLASVTIPSLIKDYQDKANKAAFKKNYSNVASAVKLIMIDNGGTMQNLYSTGGEYGTLKLAAKFKEQMKVVKSCGYNASGCWLGPNNWLNGTSGDTHGTLTGQYSMILSNGTLFRFAYHSATCNYTVGDTKVCGAVEMDMNGFKGPNVWGKDRFGLFIVKEGIIPYGAPDANHHRDANCTNTTADGDRGLSCAKKVLMNVDY